MGSIDDHGQPLNRFFNAKRITERSMDELIGVCKGIAADKIITPGEAEFLALWLANNQQVISVWPANILWERFREMLMEGKIDDAEHHELLGMLLSFTGAKHTTITAEDHSTALPFDDPQPAVIFKDRGFCLTGKFYCGTRKDCEAVITFKQGYVQAKPTSCTDYLVIGELASRDWIHSTHGRKIEEAVALRQAGSDLAIISEKHWIDSIE